MRPVFFIDGLRSPRGKGKKAGALHALKPAELLAQVMRPLANRVDLSDVEDVVIGCVQQVQGQGGNIAKIASLLAGWPTTCSGATINRFCASGLAAINGGVGEIAKGASLVAAGGVESLSQVPMFSDGGPWANDPEIAAKTEFIPIAMAADLMAYLHGIEKAELDHYALRSHHLSLARPYPTRFIAPIFGHDGALLLEREEGPRPGLTFDDLAKMPPAFAVAPEDDFSNRIRHHFPEILELPGRHTLASAPAFADAAGVLLLGDQRALDQSGQLAMGQWIASAQWAGPPIPMLSGLPEVVQKVLDRAHLNMEDIDCFEINESFAVTPLWFQQFTSVPMSKLNIYGGAIACGHPLGATGIILVLNLLEQLYQRGGGYGMAAIVAGAGVASAMIVKV